MVPELKRNCQELAARFDGISTDRKVQLERLGAYVAQRRKAGKTARLTAICTHNSRRSHFTQAGLLLAAKFYGLEDVETYSGGTEATALHPSAVAALRRMGWRITTERHRNDNAVYLLHWEDGGTPYRAFSKVFDAPPNPTRDFAAIMVCSEADAGCPFVPGCDLRLPLPYHDPKAADGTDGEAAAYDARLREICRDMLYVASVSLR